MTHTNTNKELKLFISNFNIPNPDWSIVPENFPDVSRNDLSKYENHILDAIILAWYNDIGRSFIYKKIAKVSGTLSLIVIGILMTINLFRSPTAGMVRKVSAATVSAVMRNVSVQVENSPNRTIVESTMSALLKQKPASKPPGLR